VEVSNQADLERRLEEAVAEGLAPNFLRWLSFVDGASTCIELQALEWPMGGQRTRNCFAHASSPKVALGLLEEAESARPRGMYVIANALNDAVTTRAPAGHWHASQKGGSTSDRDIVARRVLFIDVDADRPAGTSATNEEMKHTVALACSVYGFLESIVGADALAYGHSGNGRQVYVALDNLEATTEVGVTLRAILSALHKRFSTKEAHIDAAVADAKRLVPAFGTTKRKGVADQAERPHRRTAIVTPSEPHRVDLAGLQRIQEALGQSASARPSTRPVVRESRGASIFTAANAIAVEEVAQWLGLIDGDSVRCPGCGNTNGVALVAGGLKCHHNTCAQGGAPGAPGFRTPVDLVCEVKNLEPKAAAQSLAEQFGLVIPTVRGAAGTPQDNDTAKASVEIRPDELAVNDEALVHFAKLSELYQRGNALVEVAREPSRMGTAPAIRRIPRARVRELLTKNIAWYVLAKNYDTGALEKRRQHPPEWAVAAIHSRSTWEGVRPLMGVSEIPILRADGSIVEVAGYDDQTQMLYLPNAEFPRVAEGISQRDATEAARTLCEPLADFPFASEAHRAAAVAAILTPLARPAFEGCAPLVAIDASSPGTGKSLLADVLVAIASGRPAAKLPPSSEDEEMRKVITSIAIDGAPIAIFDNVVHPLGSPALDNALTSTMWMDRVLKASELVKLPLRTLWMATGNNLTYQGDTFRRVLPVRLESKLENPEGREHFEHGDLRAWVRAERPRLVAAALTLLRGYLLAGRPDQGVRLWGSFEGWTRLVAHAVAWAGLADPTGSRAGLEAIADTSKETLQLLLENWPLLGRGAPITAANALERLYPISLQWPREQRERLQDLRAAIEVAIPPVAGKPPDARRLGKLLQKYRHRVCGGRMFESALYRGAMRWSVIGATGAAAEQSRALTSDSTAADDEALAS
jgi:hypothetical protein